VLAAVRSLIVDTTDLAARKTDAAENRRKFGPYALAIARTLVCGYFQSTSGG
jgi:hypothetical protein